jgi:hypothetical protein
MHRLHRLHRVILLALLALALTGIHAQAQSFTLTKVVRPFCSIEIYGFGESQAEALANALAEAKSKYLVFSYAVEESHCEDCVIPDPTPTDPFHTTTETICWVELKICGVPKFSWVNPKL